MPRQEQPRFRHSYSLRIRPPRPVKAPPYARNARDAFGRLLQPTCQRRAPALREATPGSPEVSRAVHAPESRFRPLRTAAGGLVRPAHQGRHQTSDVPVIASLLRTFVRIVRRPSSLPAAPVKVAALPRTETSSIDEEGFRPFPEARPESRTPVLVTPSPIAVSRARLDCFPRPQPQPEPLPTVRQRLPTSATSTKDGHDLGTPAPRTDPAWRAVRRPHPPGRPGVGPRAAESEPKLFESR